MKKTDILKYFIIFSLLSGIMGCGKDGPGGPSNEVLELIEQAWSKFEAATSDYTEALSDFSEAINLDSNVADAYVGKGWCYARSASGPNNINYDLAIDLWKQAASKDSESVDAYAGLAHVYNVKNDYANSILYADNALELESAYIFNHDTEITWRDLQLVKAHSYYYLGIYDEVAAVLDILLPLLNHPVDQPEILLARMQELFDANQASVK